MTVYANIPGAERSHPFHSVTQRSLTNAAVLFLLCGSLIAEAGLIRGGGRSSNTVITDATSAGTVPFLVADPSEADNSQLIGVPGSSLGLTGSDLSSFAAYGFGPGGFQTSVSHDWGRDCALNTDCFFELGASEVLDWQGHIVGLPEQLSGGDTYNAVADLRVTWEFLAVEAPPPGVFVSGGLPSRSLGDDFVWSSLFSANSDGSYAPGLGNPSVTLGESLGYLPAVDEFSGCFTPYPAGPPVLPLEEAYSRGACRELGFDLGLESAAPTGADLRDQLLANEFLSLVIITELIAPDNFQFANLYELGSTRGVDAILPGATGLSTPDSIRALDSIEYLGCSAQNGSDCDRFVTSSITMRINVEDGPGEVPAPATLWLCLAGAVACSQLRRRRLWSPSGVRGRQARRGSLD